MSDRIFCNCGQYTAIRSAKTRMGPNLLPGWTLTETCLCCGHSRSIMCAQETTDILEAIEAVHPGCPVEHIADGNGLFK